MEKEVREGRMIGGPGWRAIDIQNFFGGKNFYGIPSGAVVKDAIYMAELFTITATLVGILILLMRHTHVRAYSTKRSVKPLPFFMM